MSHSGEEGGRKKSSLNLFENKSFDGGFFFAFLFFLPRTQAHKYMRIYTLVYVRGLVGVGSYELSI